MKKTTQRLSPKERRNLVKTVLREALGPRRARAGTDGYSDSDSDSFGSSRHYRGSRKTKYNEKWKISEETADAEMMDGDLSELRFRSRQLVKDNPLAEGTIIAYKSMIVGEGPTVRCQVTDNDAGQKQIQAVIEQSLYECDVTGEKSLTDMCRNVVDSVCSEGDVLSILPLDTNRPKLQTVIQLIEADRIGTPAGMLSDPIRHGVKYRPDGKIDGYFVRKLGMSERDHKYNGLYATTKQNYDYYRHGTPDRPISWLLKRPEGIERPNQSRQIPLFATCIDLLKDMEDLMDVTIVGMRAAACIMGIINSDDPEGVYEGLNFDQASEKELCDKYGYSYSRMHPGTILPLRQGEKMTMLDPHRNGDEVEPLLLRMAKFLSMKVRIPYPILFLDLSEINYSSYRGGILEARKMFKGYRNWLTRNFVWPYISTRIREAWLRGMLPAVKELSDAALYPRVDWPSWGYVDPTKETSSSADSIRFGLSSQQKEAAERGDDAFEILEEKAKYYEEKKKIYAAHGVTEFLNDDEKVNSSGTQAPTPAAAPAKQGATNG